MKVLDSIAQVVDSAPSAGGFPFKAIIGVIALIGALVSGYTPTKAMLEIPSKLAKHDSTTMQMVTTLNHQLCIIIADHRKLDWRLCYTNPSEVMPEATKDGAH